MWTTAASFLLVLRYLVLIIILCSSPINVLKIYGF
nr:MAG TPA: hypothetical protein [Caudoviricetes sp.]